MPAVAIIKHILRQIEIRLRLTVGELVSRWQDSNLRRLGKLLPTKEQPVEKNWVQPSEANPCGLILTYIKRK